MPAVTHNCGTILLHCNETGTIPLTESTRRKIAWIIHPFVWLSTLRFTSVLEAWMRCLHSNTKEKPYSVPQSFVLSNLWYTWISDGILQVRNGKPSTISDFLGPLPVSILLHLNKIRNYSQLKTYEIFLKDNL